MLPGESSRVEFDLHLSVFSSLLYCVVYLWGSVREEGAGEESTEESERRIFWLIVPRVLAILRQRRVFVEIPGSLDAKLKVQRSAIAHGAPRYFSGQITIPI